jgi:hypothetical protein
MLGKEISPPSPWPSPAGGEGKKHWPGLQAEVGGVLRQDVLEVVQHMLGFAQCADGLRAHVLELVVGHGQDDAVVVAGLGLCHRGKAVFVLGFGGLGPRVVHVYVYVVLAQLADDVDHLGVAQVGAVFLEGEAHDKHLGTFYMDASFHQGFHQLAGHIGAHAVVQAAAGQDDFRVIADGLGLVREVVRVYPDAVAAHQAGTERQKVPLGAGGFQHFFGINAHLVEDKREFVDQGDVHVALGVFNHLGGFGYLDAGGLVGANGDDLVVNGIHQIGHFGGGAGGNLADVGNAVFLVARVDALGAVAGVEIDVEFQAGDFFQYGHAVFFGGAGIDRGFVNHDVAFLEHLADGLGGFDQRGEVGLAVLVNRGGHGHDEHVAGLQVVEAGAVAQLAGGLEFVVAHFQRTVVPGLQGVDAPR